MNANDFSNLEALSRAMAQKTYLVKKQKKLSEALNELTQEEIRLASILKKETADYEKMERLSLTSLIVMISRDYEEKKNKEYNEMRMAEYKYQELMGRIENLQDDLAKTGAELSTLKDVETEYKKLLDAKLSWAEEQNIKAISDFESRLHTLRRELKEADEAISACHDLISSLESALDSLSSAKSWGLYDMVGGGLISSLAKHGHLDTAEETLKDASEKARKLSMELKDLTEFPEIESLNIDSFSRTFDIFFDNIFSDFAIQSQIDESRERVISNATDADDLLEKLTSHREEICKKIEALTEERNTYLIDYC